MNFNLYDDYDFAGWSHEGGNHQNHQHSSLEGEVGGGGFNPSSTSGYPMSMPISNGVPVPSLPVAGIVTGGVGVELFQVTGNQFEWFKYLGGLGGNNPLNVASNQEEVVRLFPTCQNGSVGGTQEQFQEGQHFYGATAATSNPVMVMDNNAEMMLAANSGPEMMTGYENLGLPATVGYGNGEGQEIVASSSASAAAPSAPSIVKAGRRVLNKTAKEGGPKIRKKREEILHKLEITDDMCPKRKQQITNAKTCRKFREAAKERIRRAAAAAFEHFEM